MLVPLGSVTTSTFGHRRETDGFKVMSFFRLGFKVTFSFFVVA